MCEIGCFVKHSFSKHGFNTQIVAQMAQSQEAIGHLAAALRAADKLEKNLKKGKKKMKEEETVGEEEGGGPHQAGPRRVPGQEDQDGAIH